MTKKRIIIIIGAMLALTICIGTIVGIRFASENTSLLTQNISKEDLQENNQNPEMISEEEILDLTTLIKKKLSVHERYKTGVFQDDHYLNVPENVTISLFVSGLSAPRFFDFDDEDTMYVTDKGSNTLLMIRDTDNDGLADETTVIDEDLDTPHGIDYHRGDVYIGEAHQVVVYRDITTDGTFSEKEVLVPEIPTGGHNTRTVVIGPDEKMYVSIGSSCNVCEESDSRRAAIVRYNLDGSGEELFAEGLRNTVGFEFRMNKVTNEYDIWSVDNGRDLIGDDLPPEEVNIVKEGNHYGWPYCYGNGINNPEYPERSNFCKSDTAYPAYNMQAHSAPLGLSFIPEGTIAKQLWPAELNDNLFIGFHGSWNRTIPTGYKVVRIDTSDEDAQTVNFITGWLDDNGDVWGRPVDVGFDNEGVMYVTDDKAGGIYRVEYNIN